MRKLPAELAEQIDAKLEDFAARGAGDVTPMKGRSRTYRLRLRDWRVVFTDAEGVITVEAIGHRRAIYR